MINNISISPKVSIIIPVYNEEASLPMCLDSLMDINYPKECLEIIVIDNNSTDSSSSIIKSYPVIYVFKEKKGHSFARNKGLKIATGEIIAFTDADCVVDKNWVISFVNEFKMCSAACCGGKSLPLKKNNWLSDNFYDFKRKYNESKSFKNSSIENYFDEPLFPTCNLACQKEVLDKIGYFDENILANEDTDLVWRINLSGYQLKYVDSALVYHFHQDNIINTTKLIARYIYWQHIVMRKYKNIMNLSFNWPSIILTILKSSYFALKSMLTGKISAFSFNLFHVFFLLMLMLTKIYEIAELKTGKNMTFAPLNFVPASILWRWGFDGNIKIFDLNNRTGYNLSEIASKVWVLFINNTRIDEIINILQEDYDIDTNEIKKDVYDLILDFKNNHLIPNLIK
ncbi:MAG: PqqD family peptide modification chaperone [Elusimicrobia bacterium]|nr:PqqD family peptide modification chaperone [Candidatus Liberimonas magnetica]